MFKWILLLLALCWSAPASAQNPQCPTRPVGDSTNACASTAFVQNQIAATNYFIAGPCDGVTDISGQVNAALTALGTSSGILRFPAGKCTFNPVSGPAKISFTYTNTGIQSLTFEGQGSDVTELYWPGASCGISLSASNAQHTFHFYNMSMATGTTNCGIAIDASQSAPLGNYGLNEISGVLFRGDDSITGTDYWTTEVRTTGYSGVNFTNDNFYGTASTNNGTGVIIQGLTSGSIHYGVVFNFTDCSWYSNNFGLIYGSYIQGVQMANVNFTNGNVGIYSAASELGGLGELSITGSQFNQAVSAIETLTAIGAFSVSNSEFFAASGNAAINCSACGGIIASGNSFGSATGSPSTNSGISIGTNTTPSNIIGNQFFQLTDGISVAAGGSNVNIQSNSYSGNTANIVNAGTIHVGGSCSGIGGTCTTGATN